MDIFQFGLGGGGVAKQSNEKAKENPLEEEGQRFSDHDFINQHASSESHKYIKYNSV
jgi:hypothetical protein